MNLQIFCECGRPATSSASQNGASTLCPCGKQFLIPSTPATAHQPTDHAIPLLQAHLVGRGNQIALPREFVMLFVDQESLRARMQPAAFVDFLALCQQTVRVVSSGFAAQTGCDVQVACALLPNADTLVEVEADPHLAADNLKTLGQTIDNLRGPPVAARPVPFVFRMMVHGGSSTPPQFHRPFFYATAGRRGSLEDLLMAIAGLPSSDDY